MSEPIVLPTDPRWGIETLVDAAAGKVTDRLEIAHAAVHLVAYGLGLVHAHPAVSACPTPDTVEGCCDAIAAYAKASGATAVGAVDWNALVLQLLPLALKIIELLVKKDS